MTLDLVIITTTEQEKNLEYQLELLRRQTDQDFNLIVVLDQTRAKARNFGAKQGRADIIQFIDGDIILGDDYLRWVKTFYSAGPGRLLSIITGGVLPLENVRSIDDIQGDPWYRYNAPWTIENLEIRWTWQLSQSNCFAMSRACFEHLKGFDEEFTGWGWEDTELFYRAALEGYPIVYNYTACFWHIMHGRVFSVEGKGAVEGCLENAKRFYSKFPTIEVYEDIVAVLKMKYMNDYLKEFREWVKEKEAK